MRLTKEKTDREESQAPHEGDPWERTLQIGLTLFILYVAYIAFKLSSNRFFDFDEFQVLYESASLVRGKALYGDWIGIHFPFMNITISLLMKGLGFAAETVLAVRHFVLLFLFLTLLFVFKTTEMLWSKTTAILAVALTISCIVFLNKGIEIRHDLFNVAFNTMAAYWALKYAKERRWRSIWLSGLFLGLAVASTQKAAIWSTGILIGLTIWLAREGSFKDLGKVWALVVSAAMVVLLALFLYLHLEVGESLRAILDQSVIGSIGYLHPKSANEIYPFPYTMRAIYGGLLYENGLFYLLSLGGLFWAIKDVLHFNSIKVIVAFWAGVGILFYLVTSRPFHQNLLPTIPAMAILAAGLLAEMRERLRLSSKRVRAGIGVLALICLLSWPFRLILDQQRISPVIMNREMQNLSFCLDNLEAGEKVLSFTQQQVFFEPVLNMNRNECGNSIYTIEEACLEKKMIEAQCKVIVFDHPARYLSQEVRKTIAENYLHSGLGDILIPGFKILPGEVVRKKVWIRGDYVASTGSLEVNGETGSSERVYLEQEQHTFKNTSKSVAYLAYLFHPRKCGGKTEMP